MSATKRVMRTRVSAAVVATCGLTMLVACSSSSDPNAVGSNSTSVSPVIAVTGDIACDPESEDFNGGEGSYDSGTEEWQCMQRHVASTVASIPGLVGVLTVGDNQYARGNSGQFDGSFGQEGSWGQFLNMANRSQSLIHPTPGNHEYYNGKVTDADDYFQYFNGSTAPGSTGPAGEFRKGWYSWDVGSWHLIALNGECKALYGSATLCAPTTEEMQWLANDLKQNAANPDNKCIAAYWHRPLFTTGKDDPTPWVKSFWDLLYQYKADVVVNGHNHSYERYAKLNPDGKQDANGIAEFVVGTGGNNLYKVIGKPNPPDGPLLASQNTSYGVEAFTLQPDSYAYDFVPVVQNNPPFRDSGTTACNSKQ